MISLPRTVEPWADALGLFDTDIALSLGPWLPRLATALGPLRTHRYSPTGDPDGFSGLSRRGPYERLLITEWLLAHDHPLEFARRAAMGEHAFFELARREPAGSHRSIALFDAGPQQIGAPRIAHIAALIVLAQRAEEAKAEFCWGVAQDGQLKLRKGVTEESIKGLIFGRSIYSATSHLADWLELLGLAQRELQPDDIWFIGGPKFLGSAPQPVSTLGIEDVLEPDHRKLRLSIRRARDTQRTIDVPLPPEDVAVRILRDPFERRQVEAKSAKLRRKLDLQPAVSLVFAQNRRKLLTMSATGAVVAYGIPKSVNEDVAAPRLLGTDEPRAIAASAHRRHHYVVRTEGNRIKLTEYNRRGRHVASWTSQMLKAAELPWVPGQDGALGPCIVLGAANAVFFFLDAHGGLFRMVLGSEPKVRLVDRGVRGIIRHGGKLVVAVDHTHGALIEDSPFRGHLTNGRGILTIDDNLYVWFRHRLDLSGPSPMEVLFGLLPNSCDQPIGLVAVKGEDDKWMVRNPYAGPSIISAADHQVVGVAGVTENQWQAGLIAVDDSQRFVFIFEDRTVEMFTAEAPIASARVNPYDDHLAYLDDSGVLRVHSCAPPYRLLYSTGGRK